MRLPGGKKLAWENSRQCIERVLKDGLGLQDLQIELNHDPTDLFEEEADSLSYPGVTTIYRKEIIDGYVTENNKTTKLKRFGLRCSGKWEHKDSRQVLKKYVWINEEEAVAQGAVVGRPADNHDLSESLVMAPIGMKEDQLQVFLEACNVDTSSFGQENARTLEGYSRELMMGESALMRDAEGGAVRLVDIVVLKIVDPLTSRILVQSRQKYPDGTMKELNRLPGTKRRPEENHFVTAQRILSRQLHIDANLIHFKKDFDFYEQEALSVNYPGLRSVYRKCVITAFAQMPESSKEVSQEVCFRAEILHGHCATEARCPFIEQMFVCTLTESPGATDIEITNSESLIFEGDEEASPVA
eukprot:gnl/TRDRNA2_/TRDRNA2_77105_c0_seq1.p1 gnl/TRDRNA2_/TRDRNA2_77105_c0~~gnl/TRDRNA2_/TRDRNA2_77105_c0_seq1.p1  ORF type:complete len:357 (-),score=60.89 gnl/TRDRNA2_/TRDRNA2_77105_c0_seq1:40-1110(-)